MRRGFTLIEVMAVCTVLVVLAALTLPNVVAMREARERQGAYDNVLRLAQIGRETAIGSGKTYTLVLGEGGTTVQLALAQDTQPSRGGTAIASSEDSTASAVRIPGGVLVGVPAQPSDANGTAGSEEDSKSVALPNGVSFGEVQLDDKPSTTSDFTLHFYPDGRSEGGGFEMSGGNVTRSLIVDRNGIATLQDGNLPQSLESSWEAGQNEQRATG